MPGWRAVAAALRSLIARERIDREIDEELRFHVDGEVEAGIRAGLTPDEARRRAYETLGGPPALVRDECRDERVVSVADDFTRDIAHGLRLLRRNPLFAAIVLPTIALAIGATVAVFSVVDAWLFRPLAFPQSDRLVIAFAATPERPREPAVWLPYRAYVAWRARARSFTSVSAAFFRGVTVTTGTESRSAVGLRVTPDFFRTFAVPPLRGRALTDADATGAPVVVLSYGFWQRHFGGGDAAIGRSVSLSDVSYEVVGVMPPAFDVRMLDRPEGAEFWMPFRAGETGYEPSGIGPATIIGRLRDGVAIETAQQEVATITRDAESGYTFNFNQFVVNLTPLQADNTRTVRLTLLTVWGAVIALWLIASLNVGALLLGRGVARMREAAIRTALGSGRARLVRQFLTESFLLASLGGLAGVAIAVGATRLFLVSNPLGTLPANAVQLDLRVTGVAMLAIVVTMLVCGVMPAVQLSRAEPGDALRRGGERSSSGGGARGVQLVLLTGQVAASVMLLVATALLARTFVRLQAEPLGFDAANLSIASLSLPTSAFESSEKRNVFYRQLAERLSALPGVLAVAAGTSPPLDGGGLVTVRTAPVDSASDPRISAQDVTPAFFETAGIPILAGRAFHDQDGASSARVVILNLGAARDLFGGPARALGQRVRIDGEMWREVIGVAGGVRTRFFNTLAWRDDPIVYRPSAQAFAGPMVPAATSFSMVLHIRSARPLSVGEVRAAASAVAPRAAVTDFSRVSDLVSGATRQPSIRMRLLLALGLGSLLLAGIGVYGLAAQVMTQRLREVAIRLTLGASPAGVVATLISGPITAALAGVAVGVALALALASVLESLLFGVNPRDPVSFAAAAVALLSVTTAAALVPTIRSMRVSPVQLLRSD